jgi:hypothetical protein
MPDAWKQVPDAGFRCQVVPADWHDIGPGGCRIFTVASGWLAGWLADGDLTIFF